MPHVASAHDLPAHRAGRHRVRPRRRRRAGALPAARRARRRRQRHGGGVRPRGGGSGRLLGGGRPPPRLGDAVGDVAHVGPAGRRRRHPAGPRRHLVRGRPPQRRRQLRRPPRRRRAGGEGRAALRGRARRPSDGHLPRPPGGGVPRRQRPHGARRRARRPRRDLPARARRDDRRDPRGRAHRRGALARLRRLLRGGPAVPRRGHGREAPHHERRAEPARDGRRHQAAGRRGRRGRRVDRARARRPPHRTGRAVDPGTRRLVARRRGIRLPAARAPGVRRRPPALHHLHLGHDRPPQRPRAYERRLPHARVVGALGPLQREARRRALVHGRPRLGHRAHLRDLRPALERPDAGDLRGHASRPTAGGTWRSSSGTG